jgi:hypothetical protein
MALPGPLAFLTRRAIAVLLVLIARRNPASGQLDPSWGNLGAGTRYKERSVGYALAELRHHGLIASMRRCYGLAPTSCAYLLTCKLLILAGLVKDHEPGTCAKCRSAAAMSAARRPHNLQTNRDLLFPSGIDPSADPNRSKRGREPRRGRAGSRALSSIGSSAEQSPDPTLAAFLAVFRREHAATYTEADPGSLGAENRSKVSAFLADFVGGAWAWSEQQGLGLARADVATALFEGLARIWLSLPGTNGFVRARQHPIGLLVGDLAEVGDLARDAWQRKQARPKPLDAHEAPPGAVSAADYAEHVQEHEPEAWPDLDASEPDADELAELDAIRSAASPVGAPVEPRNAARGAAAPPVDLFLLASIHGAMERRAALAARKDAEPTRTEEAPRNHRETTEADAEAGPTPGHEAPHETAAEPRPPRLRRPGSRPFTGTTSGAGMRPDAWRFVARPEPRAGDDDDDPPDE